MRRGKRMRVGPLVWMGSLGGAVGCALAGAAAGEAAGVHGAGAPGSGAIRSAETAGPAAFTARFGRRAREVEFPLWLRVGLMEEQRKVRFKAPSDGALFLGGGGTRAVPAGTEVTVTWLSGTPADIRYQLALKTIEARRFGELPGALRELAAAGIPATPTPWGGALFTSGKPLHDNRRVFLVAAEYRDLARAEAAKKSWVQRGQRPFFHEEALAPATARVRVTGAGETWEGAAPIRFAAQGGRVHIFDVEFGKGQSWHGFQDRDYFGGLTVAADRLGKLAAVNRVEFETYLRGVVPSEIPASSAPPALRAQAIAARGETLAKYGLGSPADPYDICSSVRCQVYGGITKETPQTNAAVAATQGVVMQHGGEIVDAVYAAVCGGHTESNDLVWTSPPNPALRGRPDGVGVASPVTAANIEAFLADTDSAWCKAGGEKFRWSKTMTQAELAATLKARADIDVGTITGFELGARGRSGRLRRLDVVGTAGRATIAKELPIRRAFGNLRSALFVVDYDRGPGGALRAATFRGAGWGHGVGLCQIGARAQAAAGRSHEAILKTYYQGISLNKVDGP